MNRFNGEEFYKSCDKKIYEMSEISEKNAKYENYEIAIISLELVVLEKIKRNCKIYLSGLHRAGLTSTNSCDSIQLFVDIGDSYYRAADFERDVGITNLLKVIVAHDRDWIIAK